MVMSSIEWAKIERTPGTFGNAAPAGHRCTMTGRIEGTAPPVSVARSVAPRSARIRRTVIQLSPPRFGTANLGLHVLPLPAPMLSIISLVVRPLRVARILTWPGKVHPPHCTRTGC